MAMQEGPRILPSKVLKSNLSNDEYLSSLKILDSGLNFLFQHNYTKRSLTEKVLDVY